MIKHHLWRLLVVGLILGTPLSGTTSLARSRMGELQNRYLIDISQDGIYAISHDELDDLYEIDHIDPRNLQLRDQFGSVDIYITGEDDGSFDPEDKLIFYGQAIDIDPFAHIFSSTNMHVLTVGDAAGSRMGTADGDPAGSALAPEPHYRHTAHAEESHCLDSGTFAPSGFWYWQCVYSVTPVTNQFAIVLDAIAPTTSISATVRGEMLGVYPASNLDFQFNSASLQNIVWNPNGTGSSTFEGHIDQADILNGVNVLYIIANGSQAEPTSYNFDWFEVDYQRHFMVASNRLSFSQPITGTHKYQIGGFSDTTDLVVLDVTSPSNPTRIISPTIAGGPVTFLATNGGTGTYAVASNPGFLKPDRIQYIKALDYFNATPGDGQVILEWGAPAEFTRSGFFIRRSLEQYGRYERIPADRPHFEPPGLTTYEYTDTDVVNGQMYFYKIEEVNHHEIELTLFGPRHAVPTEAPKSTVPPDSGLDSEDPTATNTPLPSPTSTATEASTAGKNLTATPTPVQPLSDGQSPTLTYTPPPAPTETGTAWQPSPTPTASETPPSESSSASEVGSNTTDLDAPMVVGPPEDAPAAAQESEPELSENLFTRLIGTEGPIRVALILMIVAFWVALAIGGSIYINRVRFK